MLNEKKSISKGYLLNDSIYIISGNDKIIEIREQMSGCLGLGKERGRKEAQRSSSLGIKQTVLYLNCSGSYINLYM